MHIVLLRYVLHSLMLLSMEFGGFHIGMRNTVAHLINRNTSLENFNSTKELLNHRLKIDYQTLKERVGGTDEHVLVGVHMILSKWQLNSHCLTIPSGRAR